MSPGCAALLGLLLALGRTDSGPPRPQGTPAAFVCVSLLTYPAEGDAAALVNRLEAVYARPDRVRWSRNLVGGKPGDRDVQYRSGDTAWVLRKRAASSEELTGAERDALFLQMELRRAVLFHPGDYAWSEGRHASERSAPVPRRRAQAPAAEPLGRLEAQLDEQGRLRRMVVFDALGAEGDAVEIEAHDEDGHPRRMRFLRAGTEAWSEEVEALRTNARFLDDYFRPPDRREARKIRAGGTAVTPLDIVPQTVRSEPLEAGLSWAECLARFAARRSALQEELGLELDALPTFALDGEARPQALLFRLAQPAVPGAEPPGWTVHAERPGLAILQLAGFDEVAAKHVDILLRAAPPGASAAQPYARASASPHSGGIGPVSVILPLAAPQ